MYILILFLESTLSILGKESRKRFEPLHGSVRFTPLFSHNNLNEISPRFSPFLF